MDFVSCTAALYDGTAPEPKYEYMLARLMIFPRLRRAIEAASLIDGAEVGDWREATERPLVELLNVIERRGPEALP